MHAPLRTAALGALIALMLFAAQLLIWTLLALPFLPTFQAMGLGFAEIWWSPAHTAAALPSSSAAWSLAAALATAPLVGAALALLLRWRDPDRKVLSAIRWSLRTWMSAWPWSALMLSASLALLLLADMRTLHSSVYALAIPALLIVWMSCLHPSVLRAAHGAGWWRPRLPSGKRLLVVVALLAAGLAFNVLADELLSGSIALVSVEVVDMAVMLAVTMSIVSIGRPERAKQLIRQILTPTVLPQWLLLYAITVAFAVALLAPAWMLAYAGSLFVPQAQAHYLDLGADVPNSIAVIRLIASSEFSTWLPAIVALLPLGVLCEGRLLTLALRWEERDEQA